MKRILCGLLLSLLLSCGTQQRAARTQGEATGLSASRLFTAEIVSPAEFKTYSKSVAGERFTKFIVDLRSDHIYFFDVNVYKLHVDFVFNELYRQSLNNRRLLRFNENYNAVKPEFLLCYLVHHEGPDIWTYAFWEGDAATVAHVTLAKRKLMETFFNGAAVKFRPDSTAQEVVAARLENVPWISNDKIYKTTNYHAFNTGTAIGKLRIIRGDPGSELLVFDKHDIVALEETLPDITPVKGIISERFSTPLSHLALRARAWKIPHVGLKGVTTKYAPWNGKIVYFEALPGSHSIRLATKEEIRVDREKAEKRRRVILPPADKVETAIVRLHKLDVSRTNAYGAKSANLGSVVRGALEGFKVPEGVAVPIHYYDAHLTKHGLWELIRAALKDPTFQSDALHRAEVLKGIREEIMDAPLDSGFEVSLSKALVPLMGKDESRGFFVRSSTNAEDLPGFNGAGLYDTVPNVKTTEALGAAIRKVWASVWNRRAFEEREHFGIDHLSVYGAALVQRGINATAAGVLVTANIFDAEDRTTYTINAKSGLGMRVVEGRRIPEQLLFDTSNMGIKVLSRSDEDTMLVFDNKGGVKEVASPHKGKPILSDTRVMQLAMAATSIKELFGWKQPVDIEWLFEGHVLYIVQARPYVGL